MLSLGGNSAGKWTSNRKLCFGSSDLNIRDHLWCMVVHFDQSSSEICLPSLQYISLSWRTEERYTGGMVRAILLGWPSLV